MNIISKTIHIIGRENKKGLIFLILINLINFFLEFISLISIPLFTAALLGNEINLKFLNSSLSFLNHDKILIYTTLLVILSFLSKNLLMGYNAYFQANYLKKIRTNLSKKFFNHYFNAKSIDKIGLKPSIMARNVTHVVQGFYAHNIFSFFLLSVYKLIMIQISNLESHKAIHKILVHLMTFFGVPNPSHLPSL